MTTQHVGASYVLPFSKSVPAATMDFQKRQCQGGCDITAAYLHFPSGTQGLVYVRVMVEGKGGERQVVPSPSDSFIALDNAILPVTGLQYALEQGDNIRVEWWNYDGGFPHTVPVEVIVRDRMPRPDRL